MRDSRRLSGRWYIGGVLVLALVAAGIWWQRWRGVEAELLAEEPYRILKRHDRADYDRILAAWRDVKAGDRTRQQFVRDANAAFAQVATRRLGTSSQESLQALMHDTIRNVKKLRARSPEACFRYFYPEVAGPPDVSDILSAEEQRRTIELMGEVVRSSAEQPAARPTQAEIEEPLADVINATFQRFGADAQMVAHPDDPRIDRGRVCEITTALYESILGMPPDVSTKLLRFMAPTS